MIERSRQIQNEDGLKGSHFMDLKEFKINVIKVSSIVQEVLYVKKQLDSLSPAEKIPDFESQVRRILNIVPLTNLWCIFVLSF